MKHSLGGRPLEPSCFGHEGSHKNVPSFPGRGSKNIIIIIIMISIKNHDWEINKWYQKKSSSSSKWK